MRRCRLHGLRAITLAFAAMPLVGTVDRLRVVEVRRLEAILADKRPAPAHVAMVERRRSCVRPLRTP